MRYSRLTQALTCLFLAAMLCLPAVAQQKSPVRLKLEPLSIRGRSGGPIPVQVKLEYNANQLNGNRAA